LEIGVSPKVTHELLRYDPEVIEQQLRWLPARNARRPSSLIVAAIKDNYEKPATIEGEWPTEHNNPDIPSASS